MAFDPSQYGPVAGEILAERRVPPLGPGRGNEGMRGALESAAVERLFAHAKVKDRAMAEACRSGLWLYHDFLDESHTISQSISNPTGAYWHGIMHRREPDFGNSKYWFRRVGEHPIFAQLAEASAELAGQAKRLSKADWLADQQAWDPFAFIDLCEACYGDRGPDHELCRAVGLAEWQLLFDFSYRRAIGAQE